MMCYVLEPVVLAKPIGVSRCVRNYAFALLIFSNVASDKCYLYVYWDVELVTTRHVIFYPAY